MVFNTASIKNRDQTAPRVVSRGLTLALLLVGMVAGAQEPDQPQPKPAEIQLQFGDNTPLTALISYVSTRLGLNFIYDQSQVNQTVSLRMPATVSEAALLDLLEAVLRSKGLAIESTEVPRTMRVVAEMHLRQAARLRGEQGVVTRVFKLDHLIAEQAGGMVQPYLSPGGGANPVAGRGMIVVTDYAASVRQVERLLEMLDVEAQPPRHEVIAIEHGEAAQYLRILQAVGQRQGMAGGEPVVTAIDESANRLVITGPDAAVASLVELVRALDDRPAPETRVYRPRYVTVEQLDQMVQAALGEPVAARDYEAVLNPEIGLMLVAAAPRVHAVVEKIVEQVAAAIPQEEFSPVRFYKLKHAAADDVLQTIQSLDADGALGAMTLRLAGGEEVVEQAVDTRNAPAPMALDEPVDAGLTVRHGPGGTAPDAEGPLVTADIKTNSIIVIGNPAQQTIYAELIQRLDQRRPQVLIEVILVTLDTSEGFSLGVELSQLEDDGTKVLTFSSFGLSEVDADTGSLSLTPGLGFNGAVVTADDLEMIVRALKTSGRAEISSAPRILVNDNEEGMLESVLQSPYSSVNASDTVATTSFGGFADAGTMINVTPHISEGGYLQLDYTIELSSFSGQQTLDEESGIIPPPRQKNTVQSVVTIPSGSSIIVGGLNRRDLSESIQRVPLLGQIPILEYLFSSRQFDETESTFFVFVRPTILDDEDFRDLRYLSQISEAEAKIDPGFPQSEPMLMEPTGR